MDKINHKQQLRDHFKRLRYDISAKERETRSQEISKYLLEQLRHVEIIFTYIPFQEEVNVWPMIEQKLSMGQTILTSKIVQQTKELELYRIYHKEELIRNDYGIMEPGPKNKKWPRSRWAEIEQVVVPGLAFDQTGVRLGYGGGYYDRWLHEIRTHFLTSPLCIGVGFHEQLIEKLPYNFHDERMNLILTDAGKRRAL